MRRLVRWVTGFVLAGSATACSLLTSFGDLTTEAPPASVDASADAPGGDAGAADARDGAPGDADADADAEASAPNLERLGTFDVGCAPWGGFQSALYDEPSLGRTAPASCRVCGTAASAGSVFTIDDQGLPGPPVVGARYRATVWVHAPNPPDTRVGFVTVFLRTFSSPPFTTYDQAQGDPAAVPATGWGEASVELTVQDPRGRLNVFVSAAGDKGCFVIDDVRLERVD